MVRNKLVFYVAILSLFNGTLDGKNSYVGHNVYSPFYIF